MVRFFAFKSGKWSMADVMVVSIFMAYIGFNGMIASQLELITRGAASAGVDVLTTNGTALQPGFFMFLAFCVFSLIVSTMLESSLGHGDRRTMPRRVRRPGHGPCPGERPSLTLTPIPAGATAPESSKSPPSTSETRART